MQRPDHSEYRNRERVILEEIELVIRDIVMLDVADVISFIRLGQFANLASLVTSSIEMSFAPGTLRFGHGGSASVDWTRPPNIALDMEFHHKSVHAYFRVLFERSVASIALDFIRFDGVLSAPAENTRRLAEALRNAKVHCNPPVP